MELKTQRLCIRRLSADDWMDMRDIFVDFNRSPYAAYDHVLPEEEGAARALVEEFAATPLFFAVRELGRERVLGYVCFREEADGYEVGYCFHSDCHGRGYAHESAQALMTYLAQTAGVRRFTAGTALANEPSCRLLERLGFVCTGVETVSFVPGFSFEGGIFVRAVQG